MSWLTDLLGKTIYKDSTQYADRKILRFAGAGVSVADNGTDGSTDVTIPAVSNTKDSGGTLLTDRGVYQFLDGLEATDDAINLVTKVFFSRSIAIDDTYTLVCAVGTGRYYISAAGAIAMTSNAAWDEATTKWQADNTAAPALMMYGDPTNGFRLKKKLTTTTDWLDTAWDIDDRRDGTYAEYAISGSTLHASAGAAFTLTETSDPESAYALTGGNLIEVPEAGRYQINAHVYATSTDTTDPAYMALLIYSATTAGYGGTNIVSGTIRRPSATAAHGMGIACSKEVKITTPTTERISVYGHTVAAATMTIVAATGTNVLQIRQIG